MQRHRTRNRGVGIRSPSAYPSYTTLGIRVDAVQIPDVVRTMQDWISERRALRFIAATGMHGVTEAQKDEHLLKVLNSADLVVPDGMPLVWLARRRGIPLERRVYGPELMETFCRDTGGSYRHFLYGGSPGVAEKLSHVMQDRFGVKVAGILCPPFRPLAPEEDKEVIEVINRSEADIIWIGLSTPKQESWMYEHRESLKVPVAVGVGAAFDFLSGTKTSAPRWMQENGLEWLFRLIKEPRRLWPRYLFGGSRFIYLVARESLGWYR